MDERSIGGLRVGVIGLGCNNFGGRIDVAATRRVVDAALDAGVNLFDTADVYGGTRSEEFLGEVLVGRRDRVVLATKFGTKLDEERKGARPDYVRRALDDSLRRLRTDHVDLYQLHRPDPETPIADTLGALNELVEAGKVREIGCSNFSLAQLREAHSVGGRGFASVQNEYSLLVRDPEGGELDWCAQEKVAFVPFFPLCNGLLTGKYRRGAAPPEGTRLAGAPAPRQAELLTAANFDRIEALEDFATERGHTLLELAFGYLLAHEPVVSVIAGATRPEQVAANVAAAAWKLSDDERDAVARLGV